MGARCRVVSFEDVFTTSAYLSAPCAGPDYTDWEPVPRTRRPTQSVTARAQLSRLTPQISYATLLPHPAVGVVITSLLLPVRKPSERQVSVSITFSKGSFHAA